MRKAGFYLGLISWTVLWLGISPVPANSFSYDFNYGLGPLDIRSNSPGQSLRLTLPNIVPGTIRPGWDLNVAATTSNVWLTEERDYILDFEIFDGYIAAQHGMNKRLGVGLFFDQHIYYGGILDGFIEGFHDLAGIDQDGRDRWPRYETWIIRKDTGYVTDEVNDKLTNNGLGALFSYVLTHGTETWIPALCINGLVRYGLEGPDSPDEPLDFGASLGASKRLSKRWFAYGQLGYAHFGMTRIDGVMIDLSDQALSGMLAVAWHLNPNFPIMIQYQFQEGAIKNLVRLNDPSHEFTIGFKWKMKHGGTLAFGLIENLFAPDSSSDFGVHLGYAYRFGVGKYR
jgi:hypothetical protein